MSSFQTSILHLNILGKTFSRQFIKSPFSQTVKIKILSSLLANSGDIDFGFTEYFIGKPIHVRNMSITKLMF